MTGGVRENQQTSQQVTKTAVVSQLVARAKQSFGCSEERTSASSRAELGVTAATVAGWRDHFLAGGQAALKTRQPDARDEEVMRLKAKIGDLTMENELLSTRKRGG